MTQKTAAEVADRTEMFVALLQDHYVEYTKSHYPMLYPDLISLDKPGQKYQRVIVNQRYERDGVVTVSTGGSVYCFIDRATGDIYKAAGYKAPAKGARGNIFNDNCDVGVRATMYGSGLYR